MQFRWSNNAKKFDIEHTPEAQKIIDYYIRGKKANDFVFPILDDIFYLNDKIMLNDTNEQYPVVDFLTETWADASNESQNLTYLVIALL